MAHPVVVLPGDGIGPEVISAARAVVDATGVEIEWIVEQAGATALERRGESLSESTIDAIRSAGVALKGPTTTPVGGGRSANLALRRALDLHTGVRPCRTYHGVTQAVPGVDLVVVRMNHEDLYAGIEFDRDEAAAASLRALVERARGRRLPDDAGVSLKPLSLSAVRRHARATFTYAREARRSRVTAVHKATVMRATDGIFLAAMRDEAARHPEIAFHDLLVDTCCAELVRHPTRFDVLTLPVVYGDIVSDIGAALVGGPGLAPGANVGDDCAVFEAAHGSAPKHAGADRVNPLAAVLSAALLLRRIGEPDAAQRVEAAVAQLLREGETVTYDLRPRGDRRPPARTSAVAAALARLVAR